MVTSRPLDNHPFLWYMLGVTTSTPQRQAQLEAARGTPEEAKQTFLEALKDGLSVSEAAAKAKRTRPWPYMTRYDDPDFAAEWDRIKPIANEVKADRYEDGLNELATGAKYEAVRLTATIVGLKMTKRFIEQPQIAVQVNNQAMDPQAVRQQLEDTQAQLTDIRREREALERALALHNGTQTTQSALPPGGIDTQVDRKSVT